MKVMHHYKTKTQFQQHQCGCDFQTRKLSLSETGHEEFLKCHQYFFLYLISLKSRFKAFLSTLNCNFPFNGSIDIPIFIQLFFIK